MADSSRTLNVARGILGALALPFACVAVVWGLRCLARFSRGEIVSRDSALIIAGAISGTLWFGAPALWLRRADDFAFKWGFVALALPMASSIALLALEDWEENGVLVQWLLLAILALGIAWAALARAQKNTNSGSP